MTNEQIKQKAEAYAFALTRSDEIAEHLIHGFISGAHSRGEEISRMNVTMRLYANKIEQQKKELDKLRNPWISVEDEKPVQDKDVIFMLPDGLMYRGFRKVIGIRDRVFLRGAAKGTNCYMISDVTHWMPITKLKKGTGVKK